MLSLGAGPRRVYLAVGATDLRKGFDGLYGLVRSRLEEDPMSGQLFVFCNAGRTRVKALYFDGSGLWLCAKRLGRGRFDWPEEIEGVAKVAVSATEFAALMDGWSSRERGRSCGGAKRLNNRYDLIAKSNAYC